MRPTLFVLAALIIGFALRSCRTLFLRKVGALCFLFASALAFYFIFGNIYAGLCGAALWFFLPWYDLLTRMRKLKHPLNHRIRDQKAPSPDYFPNAARLISEIDEAEFDHIADSAWVWAGMNQHYRIYWHPEAKAIAALCLCEYDNIAFAYLRVSSWSECKRDIHTTNYPFSPPLIHSPESSWIHLPCEKNSFPMVFHEHERHMEKMKIARKELLIPDPDEVVQQIENEMRRQIDYNADRGIIAFSGDGKFQYTPRGLFFLWKQAVKDMIRLC